MSDKFHEQCMGLNRQIIEAHEINIKAKQQIIDALKAERDIYKKLCVDAGLIEASVIVFTNPS